MSEQRSLRPSMSMLLTRLMTGASFARRSEGVFVVLSHDGRAGTHLGRVTRDELRELVLVDSLEGDRTAEREHQAIDEIAAWIGDGANFDHGAIGELYELVALHEAESELILAFGKAVLMQADPLHHRDPAASCAKR